MITLASEWAVGFTAVGVAVVCAAPSLLRTLLEHMRARWETETPADTKEET